MPWFGAGIVVRDVLKNGARLGKQLVAEGEETAWVVLAEF